MAKQEEVHGGDSTESSGESRPSRRKPLIFVSHDNRDSNLAEAFGNLLTDASGGIVKSFRSSDRKGTAGIEFGSEWYQSIMTKLDEATDVVALLTARSLDRPWILYEAGVAQGKLGTRVIGVALGIPLTKVTKGPFAQFENCGDDEDSLTKLILQLIRRHPEAEPREEAVRLQVTAFLERLDTLLEEEGPSASEGEGDVDEGDIGKLFEEVKVIVRDLPSKVEAASRRRLRPGRLFHPMMFEELLFHPRMMGGSVQGGQALGWLVFISMLREDLPWLYEPGMNFYRALRSRKSDRIERAKKDLHEVVKFCQHPIFHEMAVFDKESHMMMRHLPELIEEYVSRIGPTGRLRRPSADEDGEPDKE